jgi:hypothetical protein
VVLFALTIALGAGLLFQVQPLVGRYILPWFGGGPAVWTTCLLFFQALLLGGYAYAHAISRIAGIRRQALVHFGVVALTLLALPIAPAEAWKPTGGEAPTTRILALLAATVAAPYLALATTSPLLQAWVAETRTGAAPYRLYALSNAGSLTGLLAYPLLLEPLLGLRSQVWLWSALYGGFALLTSGCVLLVLRSEDPPPVSVSGAATSDPTSSSHPTPGVASVMLWIALSACGSVLLLATTNRVTHEMTVVPFLWVVPLCLYLVTFIIAFDADRWYHRAWAMPAMAVAFGLVGALLTDSLEIALGPRLLVYLGALFAGCMVCHGELARSRPHPSHLTLFYVFVAAGGAAGGAFIALAAPRLFSDYWEFHLVIAATCALALGVLYFDADSPMQLARRPWAWAGLLAGYAALVYALASDGFERATSSLDRSRSFFGVMQVDADEDDLGPYRTLVHGTVLHGAQYLDEPWRRRAVGYYGEGTGVWLAFREHPRRKAGAGLRVGVIGLGVGALSALTHESDRIRFYEIDPEVVRIADAWFSYREEAAGRVDVVLGDARIRLERELELHGPQGFDLLIADAFNGGAVPMHLLTLESAQLYARHLREGGVLALHVSNDSLNLVPVALAMADAIGWPAVVVDNEAGLETDTWASTWVLVTRSAAFLEAPAVSEAASPGPDPEPVAWTDDYGSLLQVIQPIWSSAEE